MLKVLIVDNEVAIRKGLLHCINWEEMDCNIVAQAKDGKEALEILEKESIDIVVSDIKMPIINGLELSKEIFDKYKTTKVILLTGYPDFEYAKKAIEYNVIDFVLKPTNSEKLSQAIEKAKEIIYKEKNYKSMFNELTTKDNTNLKLEQSLVFYDIVYNTNLSQPMLRERLEKLNLNIDRYYIIRYAIHIPKAMNYQKALEETNNIIEDCLDNKLIYFVPKSNRSYYGVVLVEQEDTIMKACYDIVEIINSLTSYTITIGISSVGKNLNEFKTKIVEANNAQQFLEYYEEQGCIRSSQLPKLSSNESAMVAAILKKLNIALESCSLEKSENSYKELMKCLYKNKVHFSEVRRIYDIIYNMAVGLLYNYALEKYMEENIIPTVDKVIETDIASNNNEELLKLIKTIITYINSNTDDTEGIVLTIKNYIKNNIGGDLSLEKLANMVYLSPSYLSKLFKKEIGINISVYVQQKRIEKAKLLLKNSNKKIYKIAEEVGISDPVYFSRIFKKHTGVKPKEFRT